MKPTAPVTKIVLFFKFTVLICISSIQFFPQKQIPQQSMRLCIRCCSQVQSFLCKFFRYRSPWCMFLSLFLKLFSRCRAASDPIRKPPPHRCVSCPEVDINNCCHHRQPCFCPVRVPDPSCSLTPFISPSSEFVTVLPRYWTNP